MRRTDTTELGRLVQFAATGAVSTLIYSAVFLGLTGFVLPRRLAALAVVPAFLVAVCFGYVANSRYTFRGGASASPGQFSRYLLSQSGGALLNLAFTWITVTLLGLAPWVALLPSVTLTPLITYLIARLWVFA